MTAGANGWGIRRRPYGVRRRSSQLGRTFADLGRGRAQVDLGPLGKECECEVLMPVADDRRVLALLLELDRRRLILGRLLLATAEQVDFLADNLLLVIAGEDCGAGAENVARVSTYGSAAAKPRPVERARRTLSQMVDVGAVVRRVSRIRGAMAVGKENIGPVAAVVTNALRR
jgi:hypothetical protein